MIARTSSSAPAVADAVRGALRTNGRPLDGATRTFMESRARIGERPSFAAHRPYAIVPEHDASEARADEAAEHALAPDATTAPTTGSDFGNVRVHTGPEANRTARAINARAFTVENHVVFADGQYDPRSAEGKRLLAHELTHVEQSRATGDRAIHRKKFFTNEETCTATEQFLVQLLFKDSPGDTWDASRKTGFRNSMKSSIETTFNNNPYHIKPDVASYESGWIDKETKKCPCSAAGFKPLVKLDFVKDGEWSMSEDWESDVAANKSGGFMQSSTNTSYGTLDEADVTPTPKKGAPAGVTQVPAVHEFGHFIGLDHPGEGLGGGLFTKSTLSPGADEYTHVGTDKKGRAVNGLQDLMGVGMALRPFYFDGWVDELNSKYGSDCKWKTA